MGKQYDVVIMGAGQNTLGTAAYLAKAGKSVVVLERHDHIGGGAVTMERGAPGFRHDLHSVIHYLVQANPLLLNDELGLLSKFGLEYFYPQSCQTTILSDFSTLELHYDLDQTCASIAQYSRKDADEYRKLVEFGRRVLPMLLAGMYTVPLPVSAMLGLLENSEDGRRLIDFMLRSPLQIVNALFESDHLRIHIIRAITEHTLGYPDDMGNGLSVLLLSVLLHMYRGGFAIGGSGALPAALRRCIEHHGGEIVTGVTVAKVLTSGGRATGLVTEEGEEYLARDAVVASIHPKKLHKFVDGVPDTILERAKFGQQSPYRLLKIDGALREPLQKKLPAGTATDGIVEWILTDNFRDFLKYFDPLRHGELDFDRPLFGGSDMVIPGRHPEGNALLYLVQYVPYNLADGGPAKWDEIKERVADNIFEKMRHFMPNMTPDNLIFRKVDSPLDMERYSPNSMVEGDVSGLSFDFFHFGGYRPMPELARFGVPGVERLYLNGPFMHPGAGVFGVGRPAAIRIFDDLGIDFDKVVAA